ncbi:MAG: glycosyltransferase family 9 protein [Terriglobales bacterium]
MAALIRLLDQTAVALLARVAAARRPRQRPAAAAPPGPPVLAAIKLVGMGDAVLMLPSLAAARQAGYQVTVVTTARCWGVFGAPGVADHLVVCEPRHPWRTWRAVRHALADAAVVLDFEQHVNCSTALAQLTAGPARRHGFSTRYRGRNRCYDHLVDPGAAPRHMKLCFDALARSAGLAPHAGLAPLPLTDSAVARSAAWRERHRLPAASFVVLAPGSGASAEFRRLPAATWAAIIAGLPAARTPVLIGLARERPLLDEIARLAGRPVLCLLEHPLQDVAALMRAAWRVVATDSGPMHLAAAMGATVIGIFGPDTPARYAPYSARSASVSLQLACSPCNNCWVYREARCTNPARFACVRGITAGQVLQALEPALAAASD